ncbi:MAG: hypothetical protein RG741_00800 [Bacteroidales bacterium]|nr:hypothetical protein [Bacteroidales bacterium]
MKSYYLFLIAGLLLAACSGQVKEQHDGEIRTYTIEELAGDALNFDGHTVRFEGVISHICKHSGDKMRMLQPDNDAFSMQVMLGDLMNNFSVEDEGREVVVSGILRTVVLNMDELEDHDHDGHEHEEGHDCDSTTEAVRRMAEKGIDPDIRPYVELLAFEKK